MADTSGASTRPGSPPTSATDSDDDLSDASTLTPAPRLYTTPDGGAYNGLPLPPTSRTAFDPATPRTAQVTPPRAWLREVALADKFASSVTADAGKFHPTGDRSGDRRRVTAVLDTIGLRVPGLDGRINARPPDLHGAPPELVALAENLLRRACVGGDAYDAIKDVDGDTAARTLYATYAAESPDRAAAAARRTLERLSLRRARTVAAYDRQFDKARKRYQQAAGEPIPDIDLRRYYTEGIDEPELRETKREFVQKQYGVGRMKRHLERVAPDDDEDDGFPTTPVLAVDSDHMSDITTFQAASAARKPCFFCNQPNHVLADCRLAKKHNWKIHMPRPIGEDDSADGQRRQHGPSATRGTDKAEQA